MSVSLNLSTASLDTHHGIIHSIPCKFTNTASVTNVKIDEYFEGSIRKSIKDEKEGKLLSVNGKLPDGKPPPPPHHDNSPFFAQT